jgi:hypothetical protein
LDSDTFGNLREWGQVLETLEDLEKAKNLDKRQNGLARILRYGQNWRLLERVLEYAKEIVEPSDELLKEICNIMTSHNFYLDARILAVDALESLVPRMQRDHGGDNRASQTLIIRRMEDILNSSEPPKFQEALTRSLEVIKKEQEPVISKPSG